MLMGLTMAVKRRDDKKKSTNYCSRKASVFQFTTQLSEYGCAGTATESYVETSSEAAPRRCATSS